MEDEIERCVVRAYEAAGRDGNEALINAVRSFADLDPDKQLAAVRLAEKWLFAERWAYVSTALDLARTYDLQEMVNATRKALLTYDMRIAELRNSDQSSRLFDLREHRRQIAWTLEALEDPETARQRRVLGDAFDVYWSSDLPPEPYATELLQPHARLSQYHWSLKKAVPLIRGASINQSQFGPDNDLRETLEALAKSDREDLRDEARTCLDHYLICERLSIIARDIENP